jgi:hypothetical protein
MAGAVSARFAEKRGNAAWAQCPRCAKWLPVGAVLLSSSVKIHCPACHHEFPAVDAMTIVKPE